jgi:hypothetical protein
VPAQVFPIVLHGRLQLTKPFGDPLVDGLGGQPDPFGVAEFAPDREEQQGVGPSDRHQR